MQRKPVNWNLLFTKLEQLENSNSPLLIFPEYMVRRKSPNFKLLIQHISKKFKSYDVFIGIEEIINQQIHNKVLHLNSAGLVAEYQKRIAFPIGEVPLDFPLIPNSWTTPQVIVHTSQKPPNLFKIEELTFLPLICYEATKSRQFDTLAKISKEDKNRFFINFSKDSFLQNTNILKWWDLFTRMQASEKDIMLLRVSTSSFTEIISRKGEVLKRLQKNKLEVLSYDLKY